MGILMHARSLSSGQLTVVDLADEHLEQAAVLFATRYQESRRHEPLLPPCHEHAERILPKLRRLAKHGSGVAALRDNHMVGFLLGQVLPSFRGQRTAYVPEWAHAAAASGRQEIYRAMYARLSARWVTDGCLSHLVTLLADDTVVDTFFWFGFGLAVVDAMRELDRAAETAAGVTIRRAGPDDAPAMLTLASALQDHLAAAPIFLTSSQRPTPETIAQRLADPAIGIFLALDDGRPVAYVDVRPANPSAAYIVSDPGTASIRGMFTTEPCRDRGIGTALLNHAVDWARSAGGQRLAVDFEPQNVPGSRFWLRHFRPVCYSMIRHIDELPVQVSPTTEMAT